MESVRAECYCQYYPEAIRDQPPRRGSWIKYWRAIVDSNHITSLHHITICTGTAQGDIDFFVKILGQRFVKRTLFYDGSTPIRSAERRVGNEGVSTCRFRGSPYH